MDTTKLTMSVTNFRKEMHKYFESLRGSHELGNWLYKEKGKHPYKWAETDDTYTFVNKQTQKTIRIGCGVHNAKDYIYFLPSDTNNQLTDLNLSKIKVDKDGIFHIYRNSVMHGPDRKAISGKELQELLRKHRITEKTITTCSLIKPEFPFLISSLLNWADKFDDAKKEFSQFVSKNQNGKLGNADNSTNTTESRVNPQQQKAIELHYLPFTLQQKLPPTTIPQFNKAELNSEERRAVILSELEESKADTLILLGDLPIQWFLKYYVETKPTRLSQFGTTPDTYGRIHKMILAGRHINVIPLCHPRQAGKLGTASNQWGLVHGGWVKKLRNGGKLEL